MEMCVGIIGGSRGACLAHTSLWDPILSFLHVSAEKRPRRRSTPPLREILDLPLGITEIHAVSSRVHFQANG